MILLAPRGMKTRATKSEPTSATTTGKPMRNIKKRKPASSFIRMSGRKTTAVVSVAMVTASATSLAPVMAAAREDAPDCFMR